MIHHQIALDCQENDNNINSNQDLIIGFIKVFTSRQSWKIPS